ncbi:hypothetical protein F8388_022065 [Cannabis sativa]|uniref:peroxidase n=1 Tax=Cannabis sativa TaxID=3483 RepID=A0A7J6G811_CANSA|nr:hypothetical protein F8388_022065 [Cannabis sativa]
MGSKRGIILYVVGLVLTIILAYETTSSSAQLSTNFYDYSCPAALPAIKKVVEAAVMKERRMGASLLRLHFHDCFVQLAGPSWEVPLGRKDSTTANKNLANNDIPPPFLDLPALITNFKNQGLDERDLVLLSGAHTLGFAQCVTFRARLYNEANIDPAFAEMLKKACPNTGGDSNLSPLDPSPSEFDNRYFSQLTSYKGVLHSDQELFKGGSTDELVSHYSRNGEAFTSDFARSMIKMGNIKPLTGSQGQVRVNCRKVNQ